MCKNVQTCNKEITATVPQALVNAYIHTYIQQGGEEEKEREGKM
jgi:hypothetical protein